MLKSHSLVFKDFKTQWYKKWAKQLKQDKDNLDDHALLANKFWQNAILFQTLWERGVVKKDAQAVGFGVGQERLPALFAKHGVRVTATDQDFKTTKAGYWSKHELATGTQSLNRLDICDKETFSQAVEYMSVDMKKVPKKLFGTYDIVWSNCALGHLGSIPEGLGFIERSLNCLKPGGWAAHTTELNILSNKETVTGGSTVIFRLKDVYKLQKKLLSQGYLPDPFILTLGSSAEDRRISMNPQYGNDYAKIQVMGHLATQIILIIHKPQALTSAAKLKARLAIKKAYLKNLATLRSYRRSDPVIRPILQSQRPSLSKLKIVPKSKTLKVTITKGKTKEVLIEYANKSEVPLFSRYSRLGKNQPITLATSSPRDRDSRFADKHWKEGKNRPATDLWTIGQGKSPVLADHLKPGQDFAFKLQLNAKSVKPGRYQEEFSIVQEGVGWVTDSRVLLEIKVV